MAKVQIKSEKLTPFGGIFSIMEQFDALLAQTIDSTLGLRCTMFGYIYAKAPTYTPSATLAFGLQSDYKVNTIIWDTQRNKLKK